MQMISTDIDLFYVDKIRADYKNSIGKNGNGIFFKPNEHIEIFRKYQETKNVYYRDLMISSVIRQAILIVKKMARNNNITDVDDVKTAIGEGLYELVKTFNKYDPNIGTYSTFIRNVVTNRMLIYFKQQNTVKVPTNVSTDIIHQKKAIKRFIKKNQRMPEIGETIYYKDKQFTYNGNPDIEVLSPEYKGEDDTIMNRFDIYDSEQFVKNNTTTVDIKMDSSSLFDILNDEELPDEYNEEYTKLYSFINELSLRDKQAIEYTFLKNIENNKALYYLTPISKKEWEKFEKTGKNLFKIEATDKNNNVIEEFTINLFGCLQHIDIRNVYNKSDIKTLNYNRDNFKLNFKNNIVKCESDIATIIFKNINKNITNINIYNKLTNKKIESIKLNEKMYQQVSCCLNLNLAQICSYASMGKYQRNALLNLKTKFINYESK